MNRDGPATKSDLCISTTHSLSCPRPRLAQILRYQVEGLPDSNRAFPQSLAPTRGSRARCWGTHRVSEVGSCRECTQIAIQRHR